MGSADAGDAGGGTLDAGSDGGLAADAGRDAGDGDAWPALRWAAGPDFPFPIDHHTTFVAVSDAGTHLYVVGGALTGTNKDGGTAGSHEHSEGPVYDGLFAARIEPDGGLSAPSIPGAGPLGAGPFARLRRLFPLAFHAQAQRDGTVVVFGGITGADEALSTGVRASGAVLRFGVEPDGRVSVLGQAQLLQVSLHPSLALARGQAFVVGGTGSGGALHAAVWGAPVDAIAPAADGGTSQPFTAQAPLPVARSHHAAVAWQDHVYVVGGFTTGNQPASDVLRSRHDASGAIVGWDVAGVMPQAPWTHSAFVRAAHLYVVGGGSFETPQPFLREVRRAPLLADGGVGAFEPVADELPFDRAHVHQTPEHDGFVFSIGGRQLDDEGRIVSLRKVAVGRFAR